MEEGIKWKKFTKQTIDKIENIKSDIIENSKNLKYTKTITKKIIF